MRLARPARGPADVPRRPRYRLPPRRSLRSFRLPGRPHPGGVPLPHPLHRGNRRQGAEEPERPRARLLDQPGGPAADGAGRRDHPRSHHVRVRAAGLRSAAAGAKPADTAREIAIARRRNDSTWSKVGLAWVEFDLLNLTWSVSEIVCPEIAIASYQLLNGVPRLFSESPPFRSTLGDRFAFPPHAPLV